MTRFELHVNEWVNCRRCELATQRRNVVIARGALPAEVVFVGEAPGDSEDVSGFPFVGPAGQQLDRIVADAVPPEVSFAMINMVGCFPREAKKTKDHRPPDDAIKACGPRVVDFIDMAQPKLIVAVGKLAVGWLDSARKDSIKLKRQVPVFDIVHPAAIVRANVAVQGLMIQRCVVTLAKAVRDAMAGKLRVGPVERVLKPKVKDIPTRSKPRPEYKQVEKARSSTFVPGAIGPPPARCAACKRPAKRPELGSAAYCDRPECQARKPVLDVNMMVDEYGNELPF